MSDPIAARLAALQAELAKLDAENAARRAPLEAEARELIEQQVAELHRRLGLSAAAARRVMKATRGLTIEAESDTLAAMDATETANARMSRARISKAARKHPFVQAFMERGETVAQAAEKLGYPRTSVQSWYRTDENARPIPRAAAQKVLKLYGVPLTAWQKLGE